MTFTEAVKTCLTTKYADFKGRASRSEFWWFFAFYYALVLVLFFGLLIPMASDNASLLSSVWFGIIWVVAMVMMLPILSAMVRRLHDIGKSGWWIFINCIPWIGNIIFFVLLLMPSVAQEAEMPLKTEEKEAEMQPLPTAEKATEGLLTAEANAKEEKLLEEERKDLTYFTLPLTLGFAMAFAPFNFWVMRMPEDMFAGQGAVALVLLITGIGVAIWKKLRWPKDKWLWIATGCIAALLLTAAVCRLFFHNSVVLTLSLFLFYPLGILYFGIRFWQANKK